MRKLLGCVAATSMMTLFSYWYSRKYRKQFREPELLNHLLGHRENIRGSAGGWLVHYAVGLLFTQVYWRAWKKYQVSPGLLHGILLGGFTGIFGASVWKLTIYLHPDPPKIEYKEYYRHLVIAHAIFGVTEVIVYRSIHSNQRPSVPKSVKSVVNLPFLPQSTQVGSQKARKAFNPKFS